MSYDPLDVLSGCQLGSRCSRGSILEKSRRGPKEAKRTLLDENVKSVLLSKERVRNRYI
jgi:hypothetical protein